MLTKVHLVKAMVFPVVMYGCERWTIKKAVLCCAVLSCSVKSDSLWPHGLQPPRILCPWVVSRQEYWSGFPCPPSGDLPNPDIKTRSSALQADSLPYELPGKPKNTGVGSLSLLQGSSGPRNWTRVSCIAGGFFTSWATREAPKEYTGACQRPRSREMGICWSKGTNFKL